MTHAKWLVTYSLRDDVSEQDHEAFTEVCKRALWYVVAKEKAGKLHAHAYLEFEKPLQYVQLQRMFGKLPKDSKFSLQIKKAYNYGALEYVVKDGSYVTNYTPEQIQAGLKSAKFSKKKVAKGDLESILFEYCEYLEEHGGTSWLLRSPDRLELQQSWKDFCAFKKEWKYVDKAFPCLRRIEYGAEVLYSRWEAHKKASLQEDAEESGEHEEGASDGS